MRDEPSSMVRHGPNNNLGQAVDRPTDESPGPLHRHTAGRRSLIGNLDRHVYMDARWADLTSSRSERTLFFG
jgi:hypothetical protein